MQPFSSLIKKGCPLPSVLSVKSYVILQIANSKSGWFDLLPQVILSALLLKICFHYYSRKKLKTNRFNSSIHSKPLDRYLMRMCISNKADPLISTG